MDHDHGAARSRITLTVSDDVIRKARTLTGNLSATVERLLVDLVESEASQEAMCSRSIERHVEASDAFIAKHGTWAEGFSAL